MAVLLFGLLLLLVAGLTAVLGIGWFAVFPALVALAIVGWGGLTVASGRTPASELRQAEKPELLGPGGPDDPERDR
jgi:hypothetical protein